MDSNFRISGGRERRTGAIDLMEESVTHAYPANDQREAQLGCKHAVPMRQAHSKLGGDMALGMRYDAESRGE